VGGEPTNCVQINDGEMMRGIECQQKIQSDWNSNQRVTEAKESNAANFRVMGAHIALESCRQMNDDMKEESGELENNIVIVATYHSNISGGSLLEPFKY